jgi:hypothetical protein
VTLSDFKLRVLVSSGEMLRIKAAGFMRSRTLRDALRLHIDTENFQVDVYLPHYWAIYEHDGRGPIDMAPGKYMIYFPDIRDDPRVDGGTNYPITSPRERRKLTKEEFVQFAEENKRRGKDNPIMVVASHVGPSAGTYFFTRAGDSLVESIGGLDALVSAESQSFLWSELSGLGETGRVAFRL